MGTRETAMFQWESCKEWSLHWRGRDQCGHFEGCPVSLAGDGSTRGVCPTKSLDISYHVWSHFEL